MGREIGERDRLRARARCPSGSARSSCCATTRSCRLEEIAQTLDMSLGTVKSALHRAVRAAARAAARACAHDPPPRTLAPARPPARAGALDEADEARPRARSPRRLRRLRARPRGAARRARARSSADPVRDAEPPIPLGALVHARPGPPGRGAGAAAAAWRPARSRRPACWPRPCSWPSSRGRWRPAVPSARPRRASVGDRRPRPRTRPRRMRRIEQHARARARGALPERGAGRAGDGGLRAPALRRGGATRSRWGRRRERSRELLARRRALRRDGRGRRRWSRATVLDDVEEMLREVAALDRLRAAAGPGGDPRRDRAAAPPHEDRSHDTGAAGMTRVPSGAGARGPSADGAVVCGSPGPSWAQADAERLRTAKTLFFDRKYAEARQAWEAVAGRGQGRGGGGGRLLGRALQREPRRERARAQGVRRVPGPAPDGPRAGRGGADEPRRPGRASSTRRGTRPTSRSCARPLSDPSRTVRYYAALQMSGLGRGDGPAGRARPTPDPGAGEGRGPRRPREARAHALGSGRPERAGDEPRSERHRAPPASAPRARPRGALGPRAHHGEGRHQAEGLHQPAARAGGDVVQEPARQTPRRTCGARATTPRTSGRACASSVRARSSRSKATRASASRSGPRSRKEER